MTALHSYQNSLAILFEEAGQLQHILRPAEPLEKVEEYQAARRRSESLRAQGGKPMSEPQVYVSLKRMAARALIEIVEKRKVPNTPPIIIYKLTQRGKAALARKLTELGPLAAAVLSRT